MLRLNRGRAECIAGGIAYFTAASRGSHVVMSAQLFTQIFHHRSRNQWWHAFFVCFVFNFFFEASSVLYILPPAFLKQTCLCFCSNVCFLTQFTHISKNVSSKISLLRPLLCSLIPAINQEHWTNCTNEILVLYVTLYINMYLSSSNSYYRLL